MKRSNWSLLLACLLVLPLAACAKKQSAGAAKDTAGGGKSETTASSGVAQAAVKPNDDKAVPVEVTTITGGTISAYVLTNASLETEEAVDVFPQVAGIVTRLRVEESDYVEKGAVLLEVDEREYKLREEAARVNYERQQNSHERARSMFEKSLMSADEFEVAKFNLEQARIDWEQAKLILDYCRIKAPISGYISERTCKLGDRLLTTTKVYSIVNPDLLLAKIHLTEKDALRTRAGQRAEIVSEALPGQKFAGVVDRVSPVVDPTTGMVRVTIRLTDRQRLLRPGMFVNVHLITDTKLNAALIPKKAVIYDDNQQFVFVVRNDTLAVRVPLRAGYTDRENIEALEGVGVGDTIIVVGHSAMKDSTRVKITELEI